MKNLIKILFFTLIGYTSLAQDVKISNMTAATDLNTSTIPIVQGGANKKAAISLFDTRFQATSRDVMGDANYTWGASKTIVGINATLTAARTLTLPLANSVTAGTILYVNDEVAGVSPTNYVTLTRAGSDVINGLTTLKFTAPYSSIRLESDGTSKWNFSNYRKLQQIPVISSNTFTLDFQKEEDVKFQSNTAITANFTIALSNDTNGQSFEFKIKLNGTSLTMTCPSSFTSLTSDSNWNSSTQVYTFTSAQVNLYYNIMGTWNVDRGKWEVVVGNADFK